MNSPDQPADQFVILTSVPNEAEAAGLIGLFKEEGLELFMDGGSDMALFAEDTGDVNMVVRKEIFEAAAKLLKDIEAENADFSWDDVDVGEPED